MNVKKTNFRDQSTASADSQYRKALYWFNNQEFEKSLEFFDSVLKQNPDHLLAHRSRSVVLFKLGRFNEAAYSFHRLHEKLPEDMLLLKYCGIAYNSSGNFELAIQFLSRYVSKTPNDFDAWSALTYAAGKSQKHTDSMMYATKALSIAPTNPSAYNNLGAALLGVEQLDGAEQAFETALLLEPNNIDALSNIATLKEKRFEFEDAIKAYDDLLLQVDIKSEFFKEILYRSSFPYLATGRLKEGWRRYDYGFSPKDTASRTPKRIFSVPMWMGEAIGDKRLLIWGEQGLGDELWFYGVLNEAIEVCPNIILECEPRLISLMTRSFPSITVRQKTLNSFDFNDSLDFDLHLPAGSLMSVFRNNIVDLKKFHPYVKRSCELSLDFSNRLSEFSGKTLIGLCWRSGNLNIGRNKHYLSLDSLAPLLMTKNCTFVNLQYGACEEELTRVERALGISIIRWSDVDLKNNQEQVAAIIDNLDFVVTAGTAVAQMAIAVGADTILFGPRGWTYLGQDSYPWSDKVISFNPTNDEELEAVIPKMVDYIENQITSNPH